MKKAEKNVGEVSDLVFDIVEDKSFKTAQALEKLLKSNGFKVTDTVPSEYIAVIYKGVSYLIFLSSSKPYTVVGVDYDVESLADYSLEDDD